MYEPIVPIWLTEGTRVRLRQSVERSAEILIPAGEEGTVVVVDLPHEMVCVKLDRHFPELDHWDNELVWYEEHLLAEVASDLEPIAPVP